MRMHRTLLGLVLLSAASCSTRATEQASPASAYENYARFLAGIRNPGGPLAAREQSPAWIRFAQYFDESWHVFDERQLAPMRKWAPEALGPTASADTPVFYPFSGPDFVNMYALFPRAKTYVMVALNPVGEIPDFASMNDRQLDDFFVRLHRSIYDLLHLDFFITKQMKITLGPTGVDGVLPVLLFFMARTGVTVLDVKYWQTNPEGVVVETPALPGRSAGQQGVSGLRLVFQSSGSEERQTLDYLRLNLDNESLVTHPRVVSFIEDFTPATTFIKAASYLMFSPGFLDIAHFILEHSDHVLQTASGMPFQRFSPSLWKIQLFGTYTGPIEVFRREYQADLVEAYRRGENVHPLPFGIGYHFRPGTSDLLFASRKRP
jgi:hypothetical protein